MNSGGHRFFTVVTIITMIFGPVFLHHHWVYELTSITSDTHNVQCVVHEPCPKQKVIVNVVRPPLPADPPKGKNDDDKGKKDEKGKKGDNATAQANLTPAPAQ
jgi:hypothetical protein